MTNKHVFAVSLDEPVQGFADVLKAKYPDAYSHTSLLHLACEPGVLTRQVAESLGLDGSDDTRGGVVFKLNRAHAGYTEGAPWEWLENARRAE